MPAGTEAASTADARLGIFRSALVLTGLLLLLVGVADLVVGHRKLAEYRAELRAIPPPPPPDPAELFPKLSVADQKEAMLTAKIGYYRMLNTFGRVLILVGAGTIGAGIIRYRLAIADSR